MSRKLDHEKASWEAEIRARGAEFIDHADRTLSPCGYPSKQDMERSAPCCTHAPIDTPLIVRHESREEFIAHVIRGEREQADAMLALKMSRAAARASRVATKTRRPKR